MIFFNEIEVNLTQEATMHLISDELAHQLGLKEATSGRGRSNQFSDSDSSSSSPCPRKTKKLWKRLEKCHSRNAFAPGPADPSQPSFAPAPAYHPGLYPGGRRFWKMSPDLHIHINSSPPVAVGHGVRTISENAPSKDSQPSRPVTAHCSKKSSSDVQPGLPVNAQTETFSKSEIEELLSMSLGDLLKLKAQAKASSPLI